MESSVDSSIPLQSAVGIATGATTELPHRPKPCENTQDMAIVSTTPYNEGDDDILEPTAGNQESNAPTAPKKKKKKRPKGGRKKLLLLKKITGFEEYYVDAPITPAEHEEEKTLYDSSFPAVQRLETAIQRFQAKRRLDNERRLTFTKYLSYGGVNVGPRMFAGNDPRDIADMDGDAIIQATAQSSIPEDRSDWQVGFEIVAKGFFSTTLPAFSALDTEKEVDVATSTIKNFLNYILYHRVCPEYGEDIIAARGVCDTANIELWKAHQTCAWVPGDFNMACATLFGGSYFDTYTGDQDWVKKDDGTAGMPYNTARKVVKFALAGAGTYEQAHRFRDLANANTIEAKCIDENGFEVLAITSPADEVKDFYNQYAKDLKPVGKIRARPWRDPGLPGEDLPPGGVPFDGTGGEGVEYEFFVEETILKWCFVGMKVKADIWSLNCGVHYFDNVLGVYCSFYTVLANESMLGWKEPRDLKSDELSWAEGKAAARGDVPDTLG